VAEALPPPGTPVALSLRPERLSIRAEPCFDDNVLSDAVVDDIVYLGTVSTYLARTASGQVMRVTRQNGTGAAIARGDRVSVTWPATAAVVLTA